MTDPSKTYNIVFSNNDCEESVTLQAASDSINWEMFLGTTAGLFVRHDLSQSEAMAEIQNLVDLLLKTRYNTTENNSTATK